MSPQQPSPAQAGGLVSAVDAVHGIIDLRDEEGAEMDGCIVALLGSEPVRRLHRIKQLGYVSHAFPSADHSRHAHALGTLHTMRMLLDRLERGGLFADSFLDAIEQPFPAALGQTGQRTAVLRQHMLVAALLQDVGELPYHQALQHVYRPAESVISTASSEVSDFVHNPRRVKETFGIAAVLDADRMPLHVGIDRKLLTYLLTGQPHTSRNPATATLRQMLDGIVDADRLDYVFRDAHHTMGATGSARDVVESILTYDENGPIFSETRAVASFLATRAHLWTSIYFSPYQRFQMLLLLTLFRDLEKNRTRLSRKNRPGLPLPAELGKSGFLSFDDIRVGEILTWLSGAISHPPTSPRLDNILSGRAQEALKILTKGANGYDFRWLPDVRNERRGASSLPDHIFVDTFLDYREHRLYSPGHARIKTEQLSFMGGTKPLEECCGPYNAILTETASALPLPGHALAFGKRDRLEDKWFADNVRDGTIQRAARAHDPYRFPVAFLAFNEADRKTAEEFARKLVERHIYVHMGIFLRAGTFIDQIMPLIRKSEVGLVLLGNTGLGSTQTDEVMEMITLEKDHLLKPLVVKREDALTVPAMVSRYTQYYIGDFEEIVAAIYDSPRQEHAAA